MLLLVFVKNVDLLKLKEGTIEIRKSKDVVCLNKGLRRLRAEKICGKHASAQEKINLASVSVRFPTPLGCKWMNRAVTSSPSLVAVQRG